jgi:hypothetical protein
MITLIGCVRDDVLGPRRLEALLHHHAPSVICVQAQEGLQFLFEEIDTQLQKMDHSLDFHSQLVQAMEFEYLTPLRYCKQKNIPILRIGYPDLPVHACLEIAKNFDIESTIIRLHQEFSGTTLQEHMVNISAIYKDQGTPPYSEVALMDTYVEQRLRRLQGNVVYVGSCGHIFGDYHNLSERLKDLRPKRVRLCEADWLKQ